VIAPSPDVASVTPSFSPKLPISLDACERWSIAGGASGRHDLMIHQLAKIPTGVLWRLFGDFVGDYQAEPT